MSVLHKFSTTSPMMTWVNFLSTTFRKMIKNIKHKYRHNHKSNYRIIELIRKVRLWSKFSLPRKLKKSSFIKMIIKVSVRMSILMRRKLWADWRYKSTRMDWIWCQSTGRFLLWLSMLSLLPIRGNRWGSYWLRIIGLLFLRAGLRSLISHMVLLHNASMRTSFVR